MHADYKEESHDTHHPARGYTLHPNISKSMIDYLRRNFRQIVKGFTLVGRSKGAHSILVNMVEESSTSGRTVKMPR